MTADPPPSVPGPAVAGPPSGLREIGAVLGALVWWCEQTFTVIGGWVTTTPEATVRAHAAEMSRVLGEHATALRAHLPRPAPVDAGEWVRPHAPDADEVVTALGSAATSPARLAGVHRSVLPRIAVAASALTVDPGLDRRALARAVGHLLADLESLRLEGEALLQALVVDDGAATEVAAQVGTLERAWARSGVLGRGAPVVPGGLNGD